MLKDGNLRWYQKFKVSAILICIGFVQIVQYEAETTLEMAAEVLRTKALDFPSDIWSLVIEMVRGGLYGKTKFRIYWLRF